MERGYPPRMGMGVTRCDSCHKITSLTLPTKASKVWENLEGLTKAVDGRDNNSWRHTHKEPPALKQGPIGKTKGLRRLAVELTLMETCAQKNLGTNARTH